MKLLCHIIAISVMTIKIGVIIKTTFLSFKSAIIILSIISNLHFIPQVDFMPLKMILVMNVKKKDIRQ